jgi:opacity protein-like surface antigen
MYPATSEFSIYGLLGFSGIYVSGEPGWDLLDDGDFSWGLGASYNITPNISLFADYVWLFDGAADRYGYDYDSSQDTRVDTFNFGVGYRF